jgi:hypothetical protein
MTATYRAITVSEPWASCIAVDAPGAKRVENRGAVTNWRGPLLIHSGKKADVRADADPRVVALHGRDPRVGRPLGAVIAVAELVEAHHAHPAGCCQPWGELWHHGPRSTRQAVHLVLDNVRPLGRPVYCRGALGVWTPTRETVEAVTAQLDALALLDGAR